MRIPLTEIGTWLPAFPGGDGSDATADVGDSAGEITTSNNTAKTFFIC
jgi:hypothetical protein